MSRACLLIKCYITPLLRRKLHTLHKCRFTICMYAMICGNFCRIAACHAASALTAFVRDVIAAW